jgi:hypothetical protein
MSQYGFGTGTLFGTATQDAQGNTIAQPTPIKLGELQDMSLDFQRDLKVLYGQNAMPVAVAGGKQKYDFKAKFARMSARVFNDLYFGQALQTGTLQAVQNDLTGSAIPAAPYQLIAAPPSSGTWKRNLGVVDANGLPMQRVAAAPATGEYTVSNGTYTFAAADTGKVVFINYGYEAAVVGAKQIVLQNQEMGATPIFGVELAMKYQGKSAVWRFPQCVSQKLSFEPKQDDFMLAGFDFSAFCDPLGIIGYLALTE